MQLKSRLRKAVIAVRRGPLGAILMGARLGLRTPEQIQALTDRYYSQASGRRGIDYASEAHNLSGWSTWESDLIEEFFPQRGRVFVFGAGGGREVLNLARLGYEVDGCECHPELVTHANAFLRWQDVNANIAHVPPDTVPSFDRTYDATIIGWSSYGHILRRASRVALLRALHDHCVRCAPLLVSFHARDGLTYPFVLASRTANLVRWLRSAPSVEVGDVLGTSFAHCFTRDELLGELRDGGWDMSRYGVEASGYALAYPAIEAPRSSPGAKRQI